MKKDFNKWLKTFKKSVADWKYYTDFEKVYEKVNSIKIELNILNSLIGSPNIKDDFLILIDKYPETLKVIPILLAKRESEIMINKKSGFIKYDFKNRVHTNHEYAEFMENTGLFELLSRHIISDLTDYVKGVEVGLDTNARKNRTGTAMENIVETHIIEAGYIKNINYFKEMTTKELYEKFGVDLKLETDLGKRAIKKFDFVIKSKSKIYGIEVNFYSSSGSKLNETARSYKLLSQETKKIDGFEFVWITDGIGWNSAKNNLEETYDVMDKIFNLQDLENDILKIKLI